MSKERKERRFFNSAARLERDKANRAVLVKSQKRKLRRKLQIQQKNAAIAAVREEIQELKDYING